MSSEQPPVCPKCGDTFPNEHALSMHSMRNFVNCRGKCHECDASGSPCDLTRSIGPCSNCRSSGKPCHLLRSSNARAEWQCTKCLCRFGSSGSRFELHEKDCIGRCVQCVKDDLPCRLYKHYNNPNRSNDCISCLEEGKECIRVHTENLVLAEDGMGQSSK